MSFITSTVRTDSFSAGYIKTGEGSKTLVILPGLSVQSVLPYAGAVEKQYEAFLKDWTVYLIERRNELPAQYSISDMARDTADVMKALGIGKADVFGASQGGMITLTLAADYPEFVNKIAVASTSARIDDKRFEIISEWISLARERKREELYLSFAGRVYPPEFFNANKNAFIALSQGVNDAELDHFITLAEGTLGFDITDNIKNINCPVFCAFDKDDAVLGADSGYEILNLFSGNPAFESTVTEGFGHAVYDTDPAFPQKLYNFFMK